MSVVTKGLRAIHAEFISLFELLDYIVEHGECTLQEAAEFLHATFISESLEPVPKWQEFRVPRHVEVTDAMQRQHLWCLLADVYQSGEYYERVQAYTFDEIGAKDDYVYQRFGFNRAAIFEHLKQHGLNLEAGVAIQPPPEPITADTQASEPKRWPWGSHNTDSLSHLEAAARRWWVNYDPDDTTTMPTNKAVSEWLQKERGATENIANSIASILRLDGLPTGPRK